jgi:hypothetical protein
MVNLCLFFFKHHISLTFYREKNYGIQNIQI